MFVLKCTFPLRTRLYTHQASSFASLNPQDLLVISFLLHLVCRRTAPGRTGKAGMEQRNQDLKLKSILGLVTPAIAISFGVDEHLSKTGGSLLCPVLQTTLWSASSPDVSSSWDRAGIRIKCVQVPPADLGALQHSINEDPACPDVSRCNFTQGCREEKRSVEFPSTMRSPE